MGLLDDDTKQEEDRETTVYEAGSALAEEVGRKLRSDPDKKSDDEKKDNE